jgi:hypothetical protein
MLIFVAMRFEVTLVLAYAISKTTEGFEDEMKKQRVKAKNTRSSKTRCKAEQEKKTMANDDIAIVVLREGMVRRDDDNYHRNIMTGAHA